MSISVFELFKIGIGPSSSHTVGPMRAAGQFIRQLEKYVSLVDVRRLQVELFGSLALTGKGHGTDKAVLLGLMGEVPDLVDPDRADALFSTVLETQTLALPGGCNIAFNPKSDLLFHRRKSMPGHANGMRLHAFDESGDQLASEGYYSVGGGAVMGERELEDADNNTPAVAEKLPYPFDSAQQLLDICADTGLSIADVVKANELARRSQDEIEKGLDAIWTTMRDCVNRGIRTRGVLPGGLGVQRRAPDIYAGIFDLERSHLIFPNMDGMTWVNLYALAVSEENAAGGRVVTAPTNGAAGIIPAVMHYYRRFCAKEQGGDDSANIYRFFLTATAIGALFVKNASISGAEVGCQGEVGVACSMAAAGLAAVMGATPGQVENAAEIAMEHNLGLTCDPVKGLVQVPCIERNAMAAVKAINAAHMGLNGDGSHFVSLDKVIRTMRITGRDMNRKYKETSQGGLAVHVNQVEC